MVFQTRLPRSGVKIKNLTGRKLSKCLVGKLMKSFMNVLTLILTFKSWGIWPDLNHLMFRQRTPKLCPTLNVSLCLIIQSPLFPALLQPSRLPGVSPCPNISGSRPQVWRGVLGVSLGGLQLMIWLCGQQCWAQTTQLAAAAIMTYRPGRKQETGRRRQDILFI